MPLDFWIAQTDTFASILSPSPAGAMDRGRVVRALDDLPQTPSATDDLWIVGADGSALAVVETVAVGDRDVLRIGVSMTYPSFEARFRAAWSLAYNLAESLDATAFEAVGGRRLDDAPSERWLKKRCDEARRASERLSPNGLAPLEYPVDNLDAAANALTLWMPGTTNNPLSPDAHELFVETTSDGVSLRWDWHAAPFDAALACTQKLLETVADRDVVHLDGRHVTSSLIEAVGARHDTFMASYYGWWSDARDQFRNA